MVSCVTEANLQVELVGVQFIKIKHAILHLRISQISKNGRKITFENGWEYD